MEEEKIRELRECIADSDNIVFFGGAGVSTESGIPDFRSQDGLYSMKYKYPPEHILSHSFFQIEREEFYRFYRDKIIHTEAKPNKAHIALAKLEEEGKLRAVITQNIDGLHQAAGSKKVLELHGSIQRNYCMKCRKAYTLDKIINSAGVPKCDECSGDIKPDVVLYEESLNNSILNESIRFIKNAKMLIIGGTSLAVYPAAGLINYFTGKKLVLINKTQTPMDSAADMVLHGSIGEILEKAV
jgi:NAD-dependent protein deacetylases, SIR2 family